MYITTRSSHMEFFFYKFKEHSKLYCFTELVENGLTQE